MSSQRWKRTVRLILLTAREYMRRQCLLYERYLLARIPEPMPLHWVHRGDDWFLHGDVLSGPERGKGPSR